MSDKIWFKADESTHAALSRIIEHYKGRIPIMTASDAVRLALRHLDVENTNWQKWRSAYRVSETDSMHVVIMDLDDVAKAIFKSLKRWVMTNDLGKPMRNGTTANTRMLMYAVLLDFAERLPEL